MHKHLARAIQLISSALHALASRADPLSPLISAPRHSGSLFRDLTFANLPPVTRGVFANGRRFKWRQLFLTATVCEQFGSHFAFASLYLIFLRDTDSVDP